MRGTLTEFTWTYDGASQVPRNHQISCRYEAFTPTLIAAEQFEFNSLAVADISDAERSIVRMDARADPVLDPFARLLLRSEAIASSKIEGLQVGVRDLAQAEAKRSLGIRVGTNALEIIHAMDTMQRAVDQASAEPKVSSQLIAELHGVLMEPAPRWTNAGEYRNVQNWIGGNDFNPCMAAFVPPPPDQVEELVTDLCAFMNRDDLPPIAQAAIAHAQFETIHPFVDGNGRTGRALIHVVLRRRGIAEHFVPPISVVLARRVDHYINGLVSFRDGDLGGWVERFSTAARESARLAGTYLDDVTALRQSWRERLAAGPDSPRRDAVAWRLLELLPSNLALTAPAAVEATGVSLPRVGNAISQLVAAGVLAPLGEGRRNRSWEPVGLIEIIEALELT